MITATDALALPYGDLPNMALELVDIKEPSALAVDTIYPRLPSAERKPRSSQVHMTGSRGYSSCVDRNQGHVYEQSCAANLEARGFKVYDVPQFSHNYMMHVDFEVEAPNGTCFWIDVKAPKCLRKSKLKGLKGPKDPYAMPQDKYVVVELMPNGSLFGSKADYLAFARLDGSFVFADRQALAKQVQDTVKLTERAAWPECALWVPYVRSFEGRHTVMTYVPMQDIVAVNK